MSMTTDARVVKELEGARALGVDISDHEIRTLGGKSPLGFKEIESVAADAKTKGAMEQASEAPTKSGILIHHEDPTPRRDIAFAALHNKLARQELADGGKAASDRILATRSPA
jgi:hypothetical protein